VLPAIGHAPFGGEAEARVFFSLVLDKRPPRAFPLPHPEKVSG